jgi:hypothetical protein
VAGALLTKKLSGLITADLNLGIDEEEGRVGNLDPQKVVLAINTAYNRAIEVCTTFLLLPYGARLPNTFF